MHGMQRAVAALGVSAALLVLLGCGGYGVNISQRGQGFNQIRQIAVFTTSGINNPSVLVGKTLLLMAQAGSSSSLNYTTQDQSFVWFTNNAAVAVLLEPQCNAPYGGEATSTICVFGNAAGTAVIGASVDGVVGTATVTVAK